MGTRMIGRSQRSQKCWNHSRTVRSCQGRGDAQMPNRRRAPIAGARRALHVSLVAIPDVVVSTLAGLYDVMNAATMMGLTNEAPFAVEIVGEKTGPLLLASGVPIDVQRAVGDVETSDIVIVPSILLRQGHWPKGRYPTLVSWLGRMHEQGALLCSACSGLFLIAETGLCDGQDATVHFGYVREFSAAYPAVPVHPERVLVI